ncbi:MAG: hypothetical protein BWY43_00085 [candidate division WS2 bacterium ADurb.Bin280]|uniref:Uncharacterized protein n=1 Tax=candidate division WS2 bacterium ADurb.Bin280 TaxID=1852829 RepID=A0A1V5SG94_9BACT|nr:MAG: hypothetical protein BWY43_00085 [candidate division WS2 bacterium ADurb.Bin280]
MWAVFASWCYPENDDFKSAISDEGPPKDHPACITLLKFMQAMLQTNFPDIAPIKQSQEQEVGLNTYLTKAKFASSSESNLKNIADFGIYRDRLE